MQKYRYKQTVLVVLMLFMAILTVLSISRLYAEERRYSPVVPDYKITFPQDYGAHPDFRTEWWYVTGWLETANKETIGFQVTFFRASTEHDLENPSRFAPRQLIIAHAALSAPTLGRLIYAEKTAREGFDLAYARQGNTDVKLDDWYFVRQSDGRYMTEIQADEFGLELTLTPTQKIMLQDQQGFSRKGTKIEQASYYYSEPHLKVSGKIRHQEQSLAVNGRAWLDHEWSSEYLNPDADGWDWMSANLDDGSALMAFRIRGKKGEKLWAYGTLRDAAGDVVHFGPDEVEFIPERIWQSPHTDANYPVAWRIRTGEIEWQVTPLFDDQELDSRSSTGAVYWEGAITVTSDREHTGEGYLELTGYVSSLDM